MVQLCSHLENILCVHAAVPMDSFDEHFAVFVDSWTALRKGHTSFAPSETETLRNNFRGCKTFVAFGGRPFWG